MTSLFRCPVCGAEAKEVAFLTMLQDNQKILDYLDKLEEKESELPWPEE